MYRKRKPVFAIGIKGVFAPLASDSFVWDAEDVRETLSMAGKVQEQF